MAVLGRTLIGIVTLITLVGSNIADWNNTHMFSELWPPHAHFHGAWFVLTVSLLSLLSLWLVCSTRAGKETGAGSQDWLKAASGWHFWPPC